MEFSSTTPRVTIDWKVRNDLLLYGVYAEGNKPGGLNGTAGITAGNPSYRQETSANFELGAKATWLDGRLRTNVALYYIDSKDVQLTTAIPSGGQGAITSVATNQGAAEIRGAELEVTGLLAKDLTLALTYAWNDSEFTEGCDDFEFVLNTGGFLFNGVRNSYCSVVGNRLPMSPEQQASATLTWRRPLTAIRPCSACGWGSRSARAGRWWPSAAISQTRTPSRL